MVPRGFRVLSLAEGFPDFYRKYVERGKIQSNVPKFIIFLKDLGVSGSWGCGETPAIQTRFYSAAVKEQCQSTVFHPGLWSAVTCKHLYLNHQATSYSQTNSASELCHSSRSDAVCSPQSISKEEQKKTPRTKSCTLLGEGVGYYLWNHHSA